MIQHFENTSIVIQDSEVSATRNQIQELYGVAKTTLQENINRLKEDGLIVGSEIRPKSGRPYEVYNLDEIISIGLRLRSDNAIKFQRWAREVIKKELIETKERLKLQQMQLDHFWDKSDQQDIYARIGSC